MRDRMDSVDRAKQFMPFAAVKGLEKALRQREKVVVPRVELSEDAQEDLNRRLTQLKRGDVITLVYYSGEEYIERTGMVSRLDADARTIWIVKTPVPAEDILELRGPV